MAASDHLSPAQFGRHEARVTKMAPVISNRSFRGYAEVSSERKGPVHTGYWPKHASKSSAK